ncbi:trypsin-like peptidase domain-containing protein [Pelagibacterales bacterium SAG-MED31]|nr:trypsin-like peptidase domain-containing protein [Pelagibacterales bacterium SAG-MED31]
MVKSIGFKIISRVGRCKISIIINPSGAEFGQDIMAFGFPLAENLSSSVKLTRGIVSSLSGPNNDISLIQIDAAIQPGYSGGPVLNYNGQVVGVASSGLNKVKMLLDEESPYIPENVNFAVSATTLTGFLKSNSVNLFNKTFKQKSSQELAKIGMPPTIQLHCLNTITAYNQLSKSEKYNDVLLRKAVNFK